MVLSSYSEMPGKMGNATTVNITILKNDDPHGVIQFLPGELSVTIKESKGEIIYTGNSFVIRVHLLSAPARLLLPIHISRTKSDSSLGSGLEWFSASKTSSGAGWAWKTRGTHPVKKWLENILDRRDAVLMYVQSASWR